MGRLGPDYVELECNEFEPFVVALRKLLPKNKNKQTNKKMLPKSSTENCIDEATLNISQCSLHNKDDRLRTILKDFGFGDCEKVNFIYNNDIELFGQFFHNKLHYHTFRHLTVLRLELHNTSKTGGSFSLQNNLFNFMTNLTHLTLSVKGLSSLPASLFIKTKLTYLDISNNQLMSIDNFSFENSKLKVLDLSSNNLTTIGTNLLNDAKTLQKLIATNNNINFNGSNSQIFKNLSNIQELNFSYNNITVFDFEFESNLEILDLSHNHIKELELNAKCSSNLDFKLNMDSNRLEALPSIDLQNYKNFSINLVNNSISSIRETDLGRMMNFQNSCRRLDLINNKLTNLDDDVVELFDNWVKTHENETSFDGIFLTGNRINCDFSKSAFDKFQEHTKVKYIPDDDCDNSASLWNWKNNCALGFSACILFLCLKCRSKKKPNGKAGEEEMIEEELNGSCDPGEEFDEISLQLQTIYSIKETDDMKIQSNKVQH